MDQFFNYLSKPMKKEDVEIWNSANNIIPEYCDLFEDFSFSLYYLVTSTYLGFSHEGSNVTKIGVNNTEKINHFNWCWHKTIENFSKESIIFNFSKDDYNYFESFYMEIFYDQSDRSVRNALETFLKDLFNRKRIISQSDMEMFTDLYKTLERSLKV
jgi:hypothetical protein|tara:strand:+ start:7960 stop:8430 length:471 start_codon:yes stop_codon:yes gene_type:complete